MKHVLVVEDDPMNAKLFQTLLTRKGPYRVSVSDQAADVLERVRAGDVDLVIMDVSLRHATYAGEAIDGVGITRLIKDDEETRCIPVMLATAHAMQGDRESLLADSGAEDYVSKPIVDHQQFLSRVSTLIRNPPPDSTD
ncbi:MAG: response regulator [Verrucomicrobia bacterium]|nr:response regulator [Verrucomicrobiota bacterium]